MGQSKSKHSDSSSEPCSIIPVITCTLKIQQVYKNPGIDHVTLYTDDGYYKIRKSKIEDIHIGMFIGKHKVDIIGEYIVKCDGIQVY